MFSTKYIANVNTHIYRLLLQAIQIEPVLISKGVNTSAPLMRGVAAENVNVFFNDEVQKLLMKLTRIDLNIVFRSRKVGDKLEPPEYKFMTTEQVEKAFKDIEKQAESQLQMPPVLPARKEVEQVLSQDPELIGYHSSKFVFTDISFGKTERNRTIVVRDENGTLRRATWEEKSRINQIYFPRPGRQIKVPKMFEEEFLKPILDRQDYEFVLDRACSQFEPDDPIYLRVTRSTYEHIDNNQTYNSLRSTRHFGPLAFFLAKEKNIDNLLLENLQTDRLEDACWLISLYHIINTNAKSKGKQYAVGDEVSFIKEFIENDSKKPSVLNLALQAYTDVSRTKAQAS